MQIYLPIAEMSVNAFAVLAVGAGVGVLSGLFGVGGGFLTTPLLIFIGVPPVVAVATGANQLVASSFSGALTHWRRKAVDPRMALVLLAGGALGSVLGVRLFAALRAIGQVELMVSLSYVVLLGGVGGLMLIESVGAMRRAGREPVARRQKGLTWLQALPLKIRFRESRLYISAIPPFVVGFCVGVLAAIMGVGGGFIMVPAMIYLLGMPTNVVVGTSLMQIAVVAALTTVLHAVENRGVDAVLAVVLIVGGVLGAQVGARIGLGMRAEKLRLLLAAMVLATGAKVAWDLVVTPDELFSLSPAR